MTEQTVQTQRPSAGASATAAYLLLALAMLSWSGNYIVGRALAGVVMPLDISFVRWVIAFCVVLPFVARELVAKRMVMLRHWRILLLLGFLGLTVSNSCSYLGMQTTTALNAALLNSASPMLTLAASFAFYREAASARQIAGIIVSLMGVLVITLRGDPSALAALTVSRGDLLILASSASWAVYSVLLRRRPAELSPLALLAVLFAIGAVSLLPVRIGQMISGHPLPLTTATLASFLYVGLFPAVIAFFGWNRGVQLIGANRASLFNHLMPAFVAGLAYVFLGERIAAFHLAGGTLIFLGIFVANRR